MKITKEQFQAYEKVRVGGKTNMWDTHKVASLSKRVIDADTALEIIKQYETLMKKYPDVRKE